MDTYADFQGAIVRSRVDRFEAEAAAERLARAAAAQRADNRRALERTALAHRSRTRSVAPASEACDELKAA